MHTGFYFSLELHVLSLMNQVLFVSMCQTLNPSEIKKLTKKTYFIHTLLLHRMNEIFQASNVKFSKAYAK